MALKPYCLTIRVWASCEFIYCVKKEKKTTSKLRKHNFASILISKFNLICCSLNMFTKEKKVRHLNENLPQLLATKLHF